MAIQNRYYSNLAQGSFITNTGGIEPSDSALTVQASVHWPTSFPFVLRAEPGTANEEVILVTSGSGTSASPYLLSRGYDGTNPLVHAQGASIIPGFCQLDLVDPQVHINETTSTSGVHGLPANAWGGGTTQLIAAYPYTAASGTTLNITSIPPTYNHLRIQYAIKGNGTSAGGLTNGADPLLMRCNNISTNTYDGVSNYIGDSFSGARGGAGIGTTFYCGISWNNFYPTAGRGTGWIDIPNYSDSTSVKNVTFAGVATDNGGAITYIYGAGGPGGSANVSAISSIQLIMSGSSSGWAAGHVWVYGIN